CRGPDRRIRRRNATRVRPEQDPRHDPHLPDVRGGEQVLRRRLEKGACTAGAVAIGGAASCMAAAMKMSIIIPVLNEAAVIGAALGSLAPLRARGHELIVADGGSKDATRALAAPLADRVVGAPRGRARQMNAGAAAASGDALVFLH